MTNRAALLAALEWQLEMGVDAAVCDAPVDRFSLPETAPEIAAPPPQPARQKAAPPVRVVSPPAAAPDAALDDARARAAAAPTLEALREALAAFDGSALKAGARNCVFADGNPAAKLMLIGEAPGRDEDRLGKPFVGRSGQLLDRMLAAIGLDRASDDPETAAYITNVIPWRPLDNRKPSGDETALFLPFLRRHVELAQPDVILLMGATAAAALLDAKTGIMRLRGQWRRAEGIAAPCMPSLHPAFLLRQPGAKRLAWRDLLAVRAALDGEAPEIAR